MSTVVKEILAATTSAANSVGFEVNETHPTTVFVEGLAGAETAALEYTIDSGANWVAATDSNGAIALTADMNTIMVEGPGEYRIAKSSTVGSVAVNVAG